MTDHPLIPATHSDDPGPGPALHDALGGPLGIAESAAPAVVFVIAFSIAGSSLLRRLSSVKGPICLNRMVPSGATR